MKTKLYSALFLLVLIAGSWVGQRPATVQAGASTYEMQATQVSRQATIVSQNATVIAGASQDTSSFQDILTASKSVTLQSGFTKFSIEQSWSVAVPFVAAATPSLLISYSSNGGAFTAGVTVASVSQFNLTQFASTGGMRILF